MPTIEGFDFFPLKFDDHGTLQSRQEFDALTARANLRHRCGLHRARLSQRRERRDESLHAFPARHSGRTSRVRSSARWPTGSLSSPASTGRRSRFERTSTRDTGRHTRTAAIIRRALADAKAQLEELKDDDATPAQRRNLDKAIALLPTLEKNRAGTGRIRRARVVVGRRFRLDATEGLPQIRQRPGSEILARLSDPPADGTRGIGDVFGRHRRRRRAVPEPDDVVRDEGAIGNGRRQGRGQSRASTARPARRVFASMSWATAWAGGWWRLREGARRSTEAAARLADAARGGVLALWLQRRTTAVATPGSSAT